MSFIRILQSSLSESETIYINATSSPQNAETWKTFTEKRYLNWLSKGKTPSSQDPEALAFYYNSLILMKQALNPVLGTFVASFHPGRLPYLNPDLP